MPHSGLYHWPGDSLGEVEGEEAWLYEMKGVSEAAWESLQCPDRSSVSVDA